MSTDLPPPGVALAVGAHPDDIELGCGATLARWSAAGTVVHHLVLTDGSKGTWDPSADLGRLVAERQAEQRAAAAALGCTGEQRFAGFVDGELRAGTDVQRVVVAAIRDLRPDVVLGHDPWKRYRLHPDHRHAGFATVDGIVAARDPHFFADLGPHHRPSALLLWEADEADHVEVATDEWLDVKVAALLAHRSQALSTLDLDDPDDPAQQARLRGWLRDHLARHGARAGVELGEAFKLIVDQL